MTIFSKFFSIPGAIQDRSSVNTLKKRLDWGEPALTIIDVRSRVLFDLNYILGSIRLGGKIR